MKLGYAAIGCYTEPQRKVRSKVRVSSNERAHRRSFRKRHREVTQFVVIDGKLVQVEDD